VGADGVEIRGIDINGGPFPEDSFERRERRLVCLSEEAQLVAGELVM
jgi:hypothetical protein